MRRAAIIACLYLAIAGCAGVQQNRDLPRAWAQAPEEAGKLPVGRVIAVERQTYNRGHGADPGTVAGVAASVGPLAAAAVMPLLDGLRNGDWYFRHSVRLAATGEVVVRDEFGSYKVGDCVALRSQPYLLVPSLPGACD